MASLSRLSPLARWFVALGVTAVLVALATLFVDKPVADFAREHHYYLYRSSHRAMHALALLIPATMAGVIVAGLWAAAGRPVPRWAEALTLAGLSAGLGVVTCELLLKPVFGRAPPNTYFEDGTYGFFPFSGDSNYQGFPSGHTVFITAFMGVLWIYYPKGRVLYVLAIAALMAALVATDNHYLSDTVGGLFTGATASWLTVTLRNRMGRT